MLRYAIDLLLILAAAGAWGAVNHARWRRRLEHAGRLEREARRRLHEVRLSELALTAMVAPMEAPRRVHHN